MKEIIDLLEPELVRRYKNLTGDDDELFERVCRIMLKGILGKDYESKIKSLPKKHLAALLSEQINTELCGFDNA